MARITNNRGTAYNVDNGTGLDVRTKINELFSALSTVNSGGGNPTINTAFQRHIDTSPLSNDPPEPAILKIRNSTNDDYITLGTIETNFGLFPKTGGTLTGKVTHGYTGAMRLPVGTTAQRPSSPSVGDFRYNSTDNNIEFYNGSSFVSSGISSGSIVNADISNSAAIAGTKLSFTQTGTGANARTVTSRFQDTISVKDFGATGDGSTDDRAAIQAALDQGSLTGVSVYLPAGTYQVENTINIKSNNHFFGAGEKSIIRMKSTVGRETTLVRTGSRDNKIKNVIIEHMTLDFNKARHTVTGGTKPTDPRINDGAALSSSDANFSSTFTVNGGSDDFSGSGGDVFQDINQTTLCICFSEDVLINNVRALNGYKHCIDITSPKYRHSNGTSSDSNFQSGGATSLQSAQIYDTVRQNGTATKADGSYTLTITISGGHGYSVGDQVYLNVTGTTFDGMYKIDTVPSSPASGSNPTTFTVQVLRSDEPFSNTSCYVIQDQGCKRVTLQNCYAKGAGDDNITTHFSTDILITGCHSEYPCGSQVPQNSNCFEIDDGSRNVTLTNCIANNGNKGFQIKGHRYAPAPYNITVDGLRITNCAEAIDIKHQAYGATASAGSNFDNLINAWGGGQTISNPTHQIRSGSITFTGASPTAKNVSISNVQIIAPTGYRPDANYGSIGLIKADKQIQLYAYEGVMFSNIMINDGRFDLAGDQNLALSTLAEVINSGTRTEESDGQNSNGGLDEVIHILYGAQNVSFKNLSIHGFRSSNMGIEVASSLLQHFSLDGFFVIDGPKIAAQFNESQGTNNVVVIDNFMILRPETAAAEADSVGIHNNGLGSSFKQGNGSIVRYETEVKTTGS